MKPRARRRILWLAALLGMPLLLLGIFWWYVASGRMLARIEAYWAAEYPGSLHIERLLVAGPGALSLQGLEIRDDLGHRVLRVAEVELAGRIWAGSVEEILLDGLELWIHPQNQAFWRDFSAQIQEQMRQGDGDLSMRHLALHNAALHIADWHLTQIHAVWDANQTWLRAEEAAGPWDLALQQQDGALQIQGHLDLSPRLLSAALSRLFADVEALKALKQGTSLLPKQVGLHQIQATLHPQSGSWEELQAELRLADSWMGIDRLQLQSSGNPQRQDLALHLAHGIGESRIHLIQDEQDLRIDVLASELPLNELAPLITQTSLDLPSADLRGQLRRLPTDASLQGNLSLVLNQSWQGMQEFRMRLESEDLFSELAAGAQRQSQLQIGIMGPAAETVLDVEHRLSKSLHTAAESRRVRVQAQGRIQAQYILSLLSAQHADAYGSLLPTWIDLGDSHLELALPDLRGKMDFSWDGGFLRTEIASSLIDWRLAPLDFQDEQWGSFSGAFFANEALIRMRWQDLSLAPDATARLSWLRQPAFQAALQELVAGLPEGELRVFPQRFPADSSLRLKGPGDATLDLRGRRDGSIEIRPQALSLPPVQTASGSIQALHIEEGLIGLDYTDAGLSLDYLELEINDLRSSWREWQGGAASVRIDLRRQEGDAENYAGQVTLSQTYGEGRGWRIEQPTLHLALPQLSLDTLAIQLHFPPLSGHLSSQLHPTAVDGILFKDGQVQAHDLDIAGILHQLSIYNSQGEQLTLPLPTALSALVSGDLRFHHDPELRLELLSGDLREVSYSPWLYAGSLRSQAELKLTTDGLHGQLQAQIERGRVQILGQEIDLAEEDLYLQAQILGNQQALELKGLSLLRQAQDAGVKPLLVVDGRRLQDGSAQLQFIAYALDVGWMSRLPDLGLPSMLQLQGRSRLLMQLEYDGEEVLRSQGWLLPSAIDLDLLDGRLRLENLSAPLHIQERNWRLSPEGLLPYNDSLPEEREHAEDQH